MKKRYIIRKFVDAHSLEEARKMDKTKKPDDIYIDFDVWKLNNYDFEIKENKIDGFKNKRCG